MLNRFENIQPQMTSLTNILNEEENPIELQQGGEMGIFMIVH